MTRERIGDRSPRCVTERAIAIVQVEYVGAEVGQDRIRVAVMVDIADGDAMVESMKADPGSSRDVFECAVPGLR